MKRWILYLPVLFCIHLAAQSFTPGQSYFSPNGYIEYIAGNFPVIITAPHGGSLNPASIPDRTCPNATTVTDANTEVLARQIDTAFYQRYGCHPHIIINRLSRKKLDANREIGEAACGNALAEEAWYAFHAFIDSAKLQVNSVFGRGLYIDLHGHGHAIQRLELGYLLTDSELALADNVLNQPPYSVENSIRNLVASNLSGLTFSDLLRGPHAFGSLMADRGYPSVPSDDDPYPVNGDPYFDGGYNTNRHGSINGGSIDGIQIECNNTGVRNSYLNRHKFADSLSVTVGQYLEENYFGDVFDPVIEGDNGVCSGNTYYYSVPAFPGSYYQWTATNGTIVSGQGTATVGVVWQAGSTGCVSVTRQCN